MSCILNSTHYIASDYKYGTTAVTKNIIITMSSPSSLLLLFKSLCRSNRGILAQKLGLFDAMAAKHGPDEARRLYAETCPVVLASIGQHVRHSLDHVENAVNAASDADAVGVGDDSSYVVDIHYDLRKRGDVDERDIDAATERIRRIDAAFEKMEMGMQATGNEDSMMILDRKNVNACFMLSGDDDCEFQLPSSVARELGFAAHHAIHHMALIRVMATCDNGIIGLSPQDLPGDFGRAPSTLNFDHSQQQQQ